MPSLPKPKHVVRVVAVVADTFIPTSFWGVGYLAVMALCIAITFAGGWREARRIAVILAINWLVVRGIASQAITWPLAPQVLPAVTATAIAAAWRNPWAYACAILTGAMLLVEQIAWAFINDYTATAAVEDGLGLLVLAIMAVSGFWGGGSFRTVRHDRPYRLAAGGGLVSAWRKIAPRS